jgi:putative acetyltransferase
MSDSILVRHARDDDGPGLIRLIGDVFAEYPGCVLDVDGELPELRSIATAFAAMGGQFWVAELGATIVGSVGWTPTGEHAVIELRKLYVARASRRRGLGNTLCQQIEQAARDSAARAIELWSDTRFIDAHRLYAKRGYVRGDATRDLHDKSHTTEFSFRLSF